MAAHVHAFEAPVVLQARIPAELFPDWFVQDEVSWDAEDWRSEKAIPAQWLTTDFETGPYRNEEAARRWREYLQEQASQDAA
jgi:hypothetical protein